MRALTLTQPWAGLVAAGLKPIENRPRRMIKREDFGQRFGLHASREIDERVYDRIREIAPELFEPDAYARWYHLTRITSAILSTAIIEREIFAGASVLSGINAPASLTDEEIRWFFGEVGYVVRGSRVLTAAVPCRGWQGFWTLPTDVEAQVRAQLEVAA
jgi:hypothetical protein